MFFLPFFFFFLLIFFVSFQLLFFSPQKLTYFTMIMLGHHTNVLPQVSSQSDEVYYLTLRQWLGAILSAEYVNFPLNSTKRKQATRKLCILIWRDLELGPWLVNNIIDDPCISRAASRIDFTPGTFLRRGIIFAFWKQKRYTYSDC